MHIGIKVPNWGPLAGPDALARVARAAEQRGFGSVWVSDHIVMPGRPPEAYPYSETAKPPFDSSTAFIDPFVTLSYLAAVTTRVQLATGVLVLPLRQPIVTAKQAASLDVLSGGRLILGIGAGWMQEEFALLDQGWGDRGRRTDLAMRTMRACWGPYPSALPDGGPSIGIAPPPTQGRRLPILVGGHSSAAISRAVRLGDGWYASNVSGAQFKDLAAEVRRVQQSTSPGRELLVGVRPRVVAAVEARSVVQELSAAGADFVVLDADFANMSCEQAVEWVERCADELPAELAADLGAQPLVSSRDWGAGTDQPAAGAGE
ncbi:TIGR03619 family F420-dependent LLM class oxidoreductase [Jatrophihabitans sp. GAS493]|uniref:TIGR03619 family F420-dependent LLM class oxidoreductase n=1 Tax=Jatrophihabitans sp. GAS493 TaxID=1907575 RepID=UPI0012FD2A02|nr:TIGR03619 family F420-dependent LLM class oxidoreductase [Jatrophihabitans sp. GAS493]